MARRALSDAKRLAVTEFGAKLEAATRALVTSEKIRDLKFVRLWSTNLEALVGKATMWAFGSQDPDPTAQLRRAYEAWTEPVE